MAVRTIRKWTPAGRGNLFRRLFRSPSSNNIPRPPDTKTDPRIVYDKVQHFALPEGPTKTAIAGHLYFPQYGKKKKSEEWK
jgi:hypothetical protein